MWQCDPWWHHQMETFSALLALCVGNSPVTGEFPSQRPVTRRFVVFFDLRPNKRLSKAGDLRRHRGHYDVIVMTVTKKACTRCVPVRSFGPRHQKHLEQRQPMWREQSIISTSNNVMPTRLSFPIRSFLFMLPDVSSTRTTLEGWLLMNLNVGTVLTPGRGGFISLWSGWARITWG